MLYKCFKCNKETEWEVKDRTFSNGLVHSWGTCSGCKTQRALPQHKTPEGCILWFGKHKGKNITEVPTDYLLWALSTDAIGGGTAWTTINYLKSKGVDVKNYRVD